MRWLYHVLDARCDLHHPYTPTSLAREGFVHCSFHPVAAASARLYFAADTPIEVLQIDPRGLDVRVVETPRGPMPHVHQPIPLGAVVARWRLDQLDDAPDAMDDG